MSRNNVDKALNETAERLVRVLESQRRLGADSYPLTVQRLAELAEMSLDDLHLKKLIDGRSEISKKHVIVAVAKRADSPIALAKDIDQLAASDLVLEFALRRARHSSAHAFTVKQLRDKLTKRLQEPFAKSVMGRIRRESLPETVGWLQFGNTYKLFLIEDLFRVENIRPASLRRRLQQLYPDFPATRPATASSAETAPAQRMERAACDFAEAFDAVFEQLDQQLGSNNFVPLVELRRRLSQFTREQFDQGLRQLRQAGRYYLSGDEGRFGISDEARRAAIVEGGTPLYYVSRR